MQIKKLANKTTSSMLSAKEMEQANQVVLLLCEMGGIIESDTKLRQASVIAGGTLAFTEDGKTAMQDFKTRWKTISKLAPEDPKYKAFQTSVHNLVTGTNKAFWKGTDVEWG